MIDGLKESFIKSKEKVSKKIYQTVVDGIK